MKFERIGMALLIATLGFTAMARGGEPAFSHGRLEQCDRRLSDHTYFDAYHVTLEAGHTYRFQVETGCFMPEVWIQRDGHVDPHAALVGGRGDFAKCGPRVAKAWFEFMPDYSGCYTFVVRSPDCRLLGPYRFAIAVVCGPATGPDEGVGPEAGGEFPEGIEGIPGEEGGVTEDLSPLMGLWQAVEENAAGETQPVYLNLDPNGMAKLSVPNRQGGRTEIDRQYAIESGSLMLKGGSRDITLGKVLSASAEQVVLQNGRGTMTFTRP